MKKQKILFITGLSGILAALMGFGADWLLYGGFYGGPEFSQMSRKILSEISLNRLMLGGVLGPLETVFYIIGFWHIYLALKDGSKSLAAISFVGFSWSFIVGAGVFHSAFVFKGLILRLKFDGRKKIALFIVEQEDVPDTRLGFLLPNRRKLAQEVCRFVGYVFPFNPAEYADKSAVRAKLGYGNEPLVLCTVGGTSVGKDLLNLCGQAFPLIREKMSDLRVVLICGPRIAPESLKAPEGVEVKGFVPALHEHLAACDLAIVQAGNTTTLELTALKRPFLYFPLEDHFEQEIFVSQRLKRHRAGVPMLFSRTTPASLAEKVVAYLGKEAGWPDIPTDGAQKAAHIIGQLL